MKTYQANYDQIARDHIAYWRETGRNPFQEEGALARNENATVELAKLYLKPGDRVLDAGCGMGDLMLRLREYDPYGIDLSEDYVQIGIERGLNVQRGRIEKLPWEKEFFDVVLATDVLEHVLDLNKAVRELLRVLKPGGIIIARTPNEEELAVDTPPYDFVHLRRFDHPTFHLLFGKIFGCEVLEVVVGGDVIHAVARK
jgi:2-polyprenyl-3-methyl-5-hydroxy-6-metoxy-1,4-benzoquinol methylase